VIRRQRVLFVCVGNACRSPMAEAFARAYGNDVVVPASAGFFPALRVPNDTLRAMEEKNLDLSAHSPKSIVDLSPAEFDLIVNMSGIPLPGEARTPVREWDVGDPIVMDYEEHRKVRDQIETLVMNLILELRRQQEKPHRQKS
jgi:arsenate reductase (thioredoxin)